MIFSQPLTFDDRVSKERSIIIREGKCDVKYIDLKGLYNTPNELFQSLCL